MKKIKSLIPEWQKPSPESRGTWVSRNKPLPTLPGQKQAVRQPCGPKCWLKRFLEYPKETPIDALPDPSASTPAPDDQRLAVAQALYSPLWAWQTRIIKLHPGAPPDRLRCDLVVVDLIATPGVGVTSTGEIIEYEALSYSWGYPNFTHRIICNDLEVAVTEALAQTLHHLRLPDRARHLWIDAFSINQFDAVEKTRQVRNMLLIYQKSTSVVAWLGVPENNDMVALGYLHKIATSDTPVRDDELTTYHDGECVRRYSQVSADLCDFYSKPWFSRTWIRQEVFASKELTLLCGRYTWNNGIFRAIDVWQQFQPKPTSDSALLLQQIPNQDTLETMRQSRIAIKRWLSQGTWLAAPKRRLVDTGSWLEGLLAGVRFGATDSRDKVYGIVGMLEERSRLLDLEAPHSEDVQDRVTFTASIDYAKSISEVYQDITRFLVNRDRNLLPLCVFRDRTIAADGLPGWVINCNPTSRSWYVATHLSTNSTSITLLQDDFMQGLYGEAELLDSRVYGSLKITGHRICTLREYTGSERNRLMGNSLVTSPPLPDKGFFHTFIKDYEMLQKECAYQELEAHWLHGITDSELMMGIELVPWRPHAESEVLTLPKSALVSQAAGPAAFLVLVDGCPLPLVLEKAGQGSLQYSFFGPAAWSGSFGADRVAAPIYGVGILIRYLALKEGWEKEEFWLV